MKSKILTATVALCMSAATCLQAQDVVRHLTQDEATKAATSKAAPDYPAIAKQLKLEGQVQVEANIDERGAVESVKVVSGNVVLANAAVAAVKRWKFSPLSVEGKPAKGNATLSFTFKM